MLKIYGNRNSGNANKVEYTAILLGMDYEYRDIDFQKDLKTEWYMKIHPAGKIPAIDDSGFVLFESGAICRYFCEKKESDLYPKDLKQRAVIDQWIDFSVQHVGTAMGKVAYAKVFGPMRGLPVDENSLKEGKEFLERFLPIVDKQLGKHKFLASDKMTLADITLLSVLEYAEKTQYDLSMYKSISAWRNKLMAMDFYMKVHKN